MNIKESSKDMMQDPFSILKKVRSQKVDDALWTKVSARCSIESLAIPLSHRVVMVMLMVMMLMNIGLGWWKVKKDIHPKSWSNTQYYHQFQWNVYE
jgi:hypothetical protein